MTGYSFALSCPRCGSELQHRAGSTAAGSEAKAMAHCRECRREWLVTVHLRRGTTQVASQARRMERAGL